MLMYYFQITYIWSWDVASEQALKSWILSMSATIRTRVDGLSLEELHQLSGSVSSPPTSSVRTQTVRLFMPRAPSRALLTSFDTTAPQPSVFATAQPTLSAALRPSFAA